MMMMMMMMTMKIVIIITIVTIIIKRIIVEEKIKSSCYDNTLTSHDSASHADEEMLTLGTIIKTESILFKNRYNNNHQNQHHTDNEDTSEHSITN